MENLAITARTKVRRMKERASYEQAAIYAVIDAAFFATIAFNDDTNTHAIPTAIWREKDHLYIHGSNGSRLLKCLMNGAQACVSITRYSILLMCVLKCISTLDYSRGYGFRS